MKKWKVPLYGGVATVGGYYSLDVRGQLVVEAEDEKGARKVALKWLLWAENGVYDSIVPEDGLELEIAKEKAIEPCDDEDLDAVSMKDLDDAVPDEAKAAGENDLVSRDVAEGGES